MYETYMLSFDAFVMDVVDNVFTCNLLIYCFNYLFLVGGQ